jgi:glycosyltransferase involved in cell wall biosynthesis
LLAELDAMPDTEEVVRRRRTAAARLPLVAARADAILVAGPSQTDWWFEKTPHRFGLPYLRVPFGVPDQPPPADRAQIPGVPADWEVVLWWGGVWPWLDLETLIAARARLGSAPISVVVPTAPRPGSSAVAFTTPQLKEIASRHGLGQPQVVAFDRWMPYADRHRILNRSSCLAVLHRSGDEAALSFRTRALDGLWCAVPLLLSEGGEVARITRNRGWGAVVPVGDVPATAAALQLLLGRRTGERCRSSLEAGRREWTWSRVTGPLTEALPTLPVAPRRSVAAAAVAASTIVLRSAIRRPR